MKLLLDAMMPKEIGLFLAGHNVNHVADQGWQELHNGQLLATSEAGGFDVLITKDAGMPYQQNMRGRKIALLVLRPGSQDMEDLLGLAPGILRVLSRLRPGSVNQVTAHD